MKEGQTPLFKIMTAIHRTLLRDVGGEPPRLALLLQQQRVGFYIGDMSSPRRDHYGNRVIYDSLYLEFTTDDRESVLNYFAQLLLCSPAQYQQIEQSFIACAEWLNNKQNRERLPEFAEIEELSQGSVEKIEPGQWALYNNAINRQRCAAYLHETAKSKINNLCCVVTGRVNLERCQQIIIELNQMQSVVILTSSSEVKEQGTEGIKLSETLIKKGITQVKKVTQLLQNLIFRE
jgi:hypothetical protein